MRSEYTRLFLLTLEMDTGIATQNPPMKHSKCKTMRRIGQMVRFFGVGGSNDNDLCMLSI